MSDDFSREVTLVRDLSAIVQIAMQPSEIAVKPHPSLDVEVVREISRTLTICTHLEEEMYQ